MRYYAVLDTNVLVSAMLKNDSVPGAVLELALGGNITPLFSEAILQEYREVLSRSKFHLPIKIVDAVIQSLRARGLDIEAEKPDCRAFPDPDDVIFYAVVMEKRKTEDAYLVTGNLRHFPPEPFVVTPREMLDLILSSQDDN